MGALWNRTAMAVEEADEDGEFKEKKLKALRPWDFASVYCVGAILAFVLCSSIVLTYISCERIVSGKRATQAGLCAAPSMLFQPLHSMKQGLSLQKHRNHGIRHANQRALDKEHFDTVNQMASDLNPRVSCIVYSDVPLSQRIGEVAITLNTLYSRGAVDQIVVVDTWQPLFESSADSVLLWEMELTSVDDEQSDGYTYSKSGLPQSKVYEFDEHFLDDKQVIKLGSKTGSAGFGSDLDSSSGGIADGFRLGSQMADPLWFPQHSVLGAPMVDLLLIADVRHTLGTNDRWVTDALALFHQFEKLQVLGAFTGVLKDGHTFSECKWSDQRPDLSQANDAKRIRYAFAQQRDAGKSDAKASVSNEESVLDSLKKLQMEHSWLLTDATNDNSDTDTKSVKAKEQWKEKALAILDESYFEAFDSIKLKNDWDQVFTSVKRKLKSHSEAYLRFDGLPEFHGANVPELNHIPYVSKSFDDSWVPFMFVSAVKMGPIFVRRNWWFDTILPAMASSPMTDMWFDFELSLRTLANGGLVALYGAKGFRFDREAFRSETLRNADSDSEFSLFEERSAEQLRESHDIADVWNATHIAAKHYSLLTDETVNFKVRTVSSKPQTRAKKKLRDNLRGSRLILNNLSDE